SICATNRSRGARWSPCPVGWTRPWLRRWLSMPATTSSESRSSSGRIRMGIPHVTLDLREEFRREVVDDFVRAHEAGDTPNPCVRCNGLVRFSEMLELATALNADRLATGHYARIDRDDRGPLIVAAVDERKDQTYMLA